MFDKIIAHTLMISYNKTRTDVLLNDQLRCVQWWYGHRYFGNATSLADIDLTAMVQTCGGDRFPFSSTRRYIS